jgi:hypothetical protein
MSDKKSDGGIKPGAGEVGFGENGDEENEGEQQEEKVSDTSTGTDREVSDSTTTTKSIEDSKRQARNRTERKSQQYPYFVRRDKVGDERSERIELRLRSEVMDMESPFIRDLENILGGDVSKTDAREFAMKVGFENPEKVAELMRDDGFGLSN